MMRTLIRVTLFAAVSAVFAVTFPGDVPCCELRYTVRPDPANSASWSTQSSGSASMASCRPPIDSDSATLGSRKNSPATTSSTSRLPDIIAVASFHAALMSNFMRVPPPKAYAGLDKAVLRRQQIARWIV